MARGKPRCPKALALGGRGWRRHIHFLCASFRSFYRWRPLPAATGTKRKGSAGAGTEKRWAKRRIGQERAPSRSGTAKRKAAGGDDGLEKEAKRRKTDQDETTQRKAQSDGRDPDEDGGDEDYEDDDDEAVVLPDVPRPIIWGRRSRKDGKPWTCDCGTVNEPSRHLFVDLPAFECSKCKKPGCACFKFSFANLVCNGVCPIGKIQNQKKTDYCIAHSLTMQAEMTMRIMSVLSGAARDSEKGFRILDPYSLLTHDIMTMEDDDGRPDFFSSRAIERIAEVVAHTGIDDMRYEVRYKAGKVERVDTDFCTICRILADGYPLSTSIIPGLKFYGLPYGKVYKSRYNAKNFLEKIPKDYGVDCHFVVLVGASRSEIRDSYYFANTYGDKYCLRINRVTGTKSGGIGKLRAKDVAEKPFQFIRLAKVE